MARRSSRESDESRRNPRRGASGKRPYRGGNDDGDDDDDENEEGAAAVAEPMEIDDVDSAFENPASDSEEDEHEDDDDDNDNEENISNMVRRRRAAAEPSSGPKAATAAVAGSSTAAAATATAAPQGTRRRPSRATRFTGSLKEPPSDSVRDLFQGSTTRERLPARKKSSSSSGENSFSENDQDDDDDDDIEHVPGKRPSSKPRAPPTPTTHSPAKSPARRHARARKSVKEDLSSDEDSVAASRGDYDSEDDTADDDGAGHDDELKIQRILASRTETKAKWREIVAQRNSTEVTNGSRWFQPTTTTTTTMTNSPSEQEDLQVEERFLVKWSDVSYLHVSWETQADLLDQIPKAKTYLSTFFRKSVNGILLSQDDRKDGDYFDPGYTQIDRILESSYEKRKCPTSWEEELTTTQKTFDIVLDNTDRERFEEGLGRQFLIKWEGLNYSDSSWEFERDLILADIDYKPFLKTYYERNHKPTKTEWKQLDQQADRALRESYQLFGDNSTTDPVTKQRQVENYKQGLADHVFANGGQLRDYQAEGVAWFLANYVNRRSCILADEMGLGKTLQTAAFINLLTTKMHRPGPFLILVPLSTIAHWQREFIGWTGLNTIVYHGSADDRSTIRVHEFAYPCDRPQSVGSNSIYLNKCAPHKTGGPWMATVVVATPEMLTADDSNELAAVQWEVLVVDEAHRLKNHNSKLASTLRKDLFSFKHKVLLTGTPIQNDMKEFWTLLNFIDRKKFPDLDDFLADYGRMTSKEHIDQMHEAIRPYILRRLKEDVEKSVPPKEETLIEVELTLQQKQYYRALYEKNVSFLQKNKKKALDGPSLNNLAMQLRKCCNHLFLLNGVEQEIRKQTENQGASEADLLARGSGKLVLLDKLLPRLKENGHRILIFSQFKIMLDVLEDYLVAKQLKFERIDGSITGHRRQAAIDRFQDSNSKDPPFIMLLSTRAGGVGINLTAADTCIIFDSDWNPQNDLQAQARCHRIGQTKNVKVYRLLSRKSYEMQMFHMSSLKMGLDQAVLKGFETGASGEGAMTKEEVERLLRHGAYDIFNEEKAGAAEAESKDFIEQDIDSILKRRARTVVHDNTGSGSGAAGGTFSKASFVAPKTPAGKGKPQEDVDIEDPDFWKKMVGEAKPEAESVLKPRRRNKANYSEKFYQRQLHQMLALNPGGSDSSESESDESEESDDEQDDGVEERTRWGGKQAYHWKKSQAAKVLASVECYGYGVIPWSQFRQELLPDCEKFSETEIQRMVWSIALLSICEVTKEDAASSSKRAERQAERKREKERDGDILAVAPKEENNAASFENQNETSFAKLWKLHSKWAAAPLEDAVAFARENEPRSIDSKDDQEEEIAKIFYGSLWDSLKGRGWKEEELEDGKVYRFENYQFDSPSSVLNEVVRMHPELTKMVVPLLNTLGQTRLTKNANAAEDRERHLGLNNSNITFEALKDFLVRYAPLQLIGERKHTKRLPVGRRVLSSCSHMFAASSLIAKSLDSGTELKSVLSIDGRSALPHPLWTLDHDAILIKAIAKHGWVDREKACRMIVGDPEIKWGFPFEINDDDTKNKLGDDEWADLRATAGRASTFLEDCEELLDTLKGVNKHLIIESYGLKLDGENGGAAKWSVDDDLLLQASKKDNGNAQIREPVDLPTKKDLAKRAKLVLQKSMAVSGSGSRASFGKSTSTVATGKETPDHGFAVIDQSNRCCILLAEMVRGICKGSFSKAGKQVKLLCSLAHEEAVTLTALFSSKDSTRDRELGDEMAMIVDQIQLARRSMKSSAVPGKNLFRAMIGLEPVQPKVLSDPIYPSQAYLDKLSFSFVEAQPKKEVVRKDEGALGDRAVIRSLKKAIEKSQNGIPNLFCPSDDSDAGLQLAMSEALLLLVFCSEGIPLSSLTAANAESVHFNDWQHTYSKIKLTANEFYCSTKEKHEKAKAILMKLDDQGNENAQADVAKKVAFAQWEEAMVEEAVRFYSNASPEAVGKKSVLLLEKIRRFAFSNSQTQMKAAHKFENNLGPKVLSWFAKELTNLAHDFNVVDSDKKPMALSTTDLLGANPDFFDTRVAAYLDKKCARQVTSQISLLARLRSFFVKHEEQDTLRERLADAIARSRKIGDVWEKRPSWWQDEDGNVQHSYFLLRKLDEEGFAKILDAKADFDLSDEGGSKTLRSLGFTRTSIQQRANQLVRELNAIDDTTETMRMLEERRNRGTIKKQGYDRSLAECHTSKTTPSGGGIQTELKSFFASTKSVPKKNKVVVLSNNEENVTSVLAKAGKRKESPASSQENSPTDKRPKTLAPVFQVIPGKRKGSPASDASTDDKMETVVNQDGVIELVSVRK